MLPLGLLSPGERGEIVGFRGVAPEGEPDGCCCHGGKRKGSFHLEDLGLRTGKTVEMLKNGGGPILLRVDESRIAVGRGLAMKIMVQKTD